MNDAETQKVEFERGMSSTPVITIGLIVVNAVMFFATVSLGLLQSEASVLRAGALSRDLVFQGEVWRLASAMFLHGGLEHLVGNAVGLFILGMACEHAYGKLEMAGIYCISGIIGSVFSITMHPGPAVGASGAIFGLLGAMIVFFYKYRDLLHIRDKRVGNVLLLWAGYSLITAYFIPFVDNAAHIGGLIGGGVAGYALAPRLLKSILAPS